MNVGIVKGTTFEVDKKIVVASVQTLCNRLNKIPPDTFNLVIVDECFPAGTKVNGINIEDYCQGWPISSFNHKTNQVEDSVVTRVMKRKYSGKLYDFGQFKCTPNHPIFIIGIGYCLAKEIHYAYLYSKVMRYGTKLQSYLHKLWYSFYSKDTKEYLLELVRVNKEIEKNQSNSNQLCELWEGSNSGKSWESEKIHELSIKRIWLLFRKMQKRILFEDRIYHYEQYEQKVCIGKNEEKQSNVQGRIIEQNESINGWTNFLKSRWKWSINKAATKIIGIDPIDYGISNISKESDVIREVTSKMLQSRSCSSRNKISSRSRWENASIKALEILRQTKDGRIEKSWLDYIKIHKPTSRQRSSEDCKENYVYNLEVAGNNNYFASSVLVHNCHHYAARTYLETIRHWNPKLLTGWTATPRRLDGLSLSNLFEKIVFEYGITDGIRDGYLAPIEAYQVKTPTDISRIKRTAGDFNQRQLSEAVDSELRNNLIVQKYKQYCDGRQFIAYTVDIDHAYHLRDEFRKNGIECDAVSSDTSRGDDRYESVKRFKAGELQGLINCEILTEGFDYSDVGAVIMGRPTQSETLYTQCIGRGTRLKSELYKARFGTDKCTILDFVDNTGKLSLINAYELEKGLPIEDRMFLPKEHKEKLLKEEKERRERYIKLTAGKDKKVDLLKLPDVRVWDSEKMLEPATEKQIEWIKSAGIYAEDVEYTKKQASELISALPCAEWQIRYLAVNGYDVSKGASIGQFQRVKYNIDNKNKYAIK